MIARGKREAQRNASPLVKKIILEYSTEGAEYDVDYSALSELHGHDFITRGDAPHVVRRLPLAIIFRAAGAPTLAFRLLSFVTSVTIAHQLMLNVERRTKIIELLEKHGQITVGGLSKRFKTSEVTIRNDLKALHERGLIRRAHGGAVKIATVSMDPSLKIKAELHADEKRRIGAAAAEMINDGDSVILDSGTTTHQIARQIKHKKDLKVITNGLNIAMELFGAKDIQLIFLGGVIRQNSLSAVGHFAEDILAQLSADKVFLAVDACDLDFGLSTPNVEESQVNQAMARIAKEKILVADSSKFGKRSLSRIIPLSEIDVIITDRGLPFDIQNELRARELKLMIV